MSQQFEATDAKGSAQTAQVIVHMTQRQDPFRRFRSTSKIMNCRCKPGLRRPGVLQSLFRNGAFPGVAFATGICLGRSHGLLVPGSFKRDERLLARTDKVSGTLRGSTEFIMRYTIRPPHTILATQHKEHILYQ